MVDSAIIGVFIIILTCLTSYKGFKSGQFFDKYAFEVDRILISKEYIRLISSGFLHGGWIHLAFNMSTLYAFSASIEDDLGSLNYTLIYFASLIGGNILSLFIHRNHGDYTAIGASGAVCGVIFASVALYPDIPIGILGIYFPTWLYAILFISISILGIKSQASNIGHDAHLGGALIGLLTAVALRPDTLSYNLPIIILIVLPTVAFIVFLVRRPEVLLVENIFSKKQGFETMEDKYNKTVKSKEQTVNEILDKIRKKGVNSLTQKEKETLDKFSKK